MPTGEELWRDAVPPWQEGGSWLSLNPRLPADQRARVKKADFPEWADHVWLGTSGTRGVLKVAGLSRAALEESARAVNAHLGATERDVWLNPLPMFHVGGLGIAVRSALSGARMLSIAEWSAESFVRLAGEVRATLTSLVPTQVHDLVRSRLAPPASLRAVVVGGGALDETLREAATGLGWPLLPSYGLTEAASQVATAVCGASEFGWLPLLPHVEARTDGTGVLEIRGPSLLTGWMIFDTEAGGRLAEPKSADGWLRTSDRAELRGRMLRVMGRVDDLLKIRGELVDVMSLENALQQRVQAGALCVIAEPDERNGYVLRVRTENDATAEEVRGLLGIFPPYARPRSIEVGVIERTALGKIVRR